MKNILYYTIYFFGKILMSYSGKYLCYMETEADVWKRKRIEAQKRDLKKIRKRVRVGSVSIYIYTHIYIHI